jgi:hypothetical protein
LLVILPCIYVNLFKEIYVSVSTALIAFNAPGYKILLAKFSVHIVVQGWRASFIIMNTTHLAFILVLLIVLFSIITQRLLLSTQTPTPSTSATPSSSSHGKVEKLSRLIASRNESLQRVAGSMKEASSMIWDKITDMAPVWSIANDDNVTSPTNVYSEVPHEVQHHDAVPAATIPPNEIVALPPVSADSKTSSLASPTFSLNEDVDVPVDLIPPVIPDGMRRKKKGPPKKGPPLKRPPHTAPELEQPVGTLGGSSIVPVFLPVADTTIPATTQPPTPPAAEVPQIHHNYNSNSHPRESPRAGTSISEEFQLGLLKCPNQTNCIVPQLQLKIKLKIYLCEHTVSAGVRYYFLAREGLLLHPNVEMITDYSSIDQADFIVYLPGSAPWHKTECANKSFVPKLIVLDEFDGSHPFSPPGTPQELKAIYGPQMMWYFMYFKRSFVTRRHGQFRKYPYLDYPDVYPLTYSIAEAYPQNNFNFVREIEILCTLRTDHNMITRVKTLNWVQEYVANRSVPNAIFHQVGNFDGNSCDGYKTIIDYVQVTKGGRREVDRKYFQQMYNSKIIVTVNPADWEGDFRLWEAMATGALIMVDPLFVPHPFPLIDGVHVVYFNTEDKSELFAKLDYYRAHPDKARKVAVNGYLHAMKYHRTVSTVDYILRSAHLKRATIKNTTPLPSYYYSAQYLNYATNMQKDVIRSILKPGEYGLHIMHNHTHILKI